jgi:hypothetical protein
MRKLWRYISTFIKHWYTFFILLASDPFDILERYFSVIYSPPHWLFWLFLILAIGLALLLTILDLRKLARNNPIAWEVYDNLCKLFRELTHTGEKKERDIIHSKIEKERGKLPDKTLDKMIRLFLNAEAERLRFGMDSYIDDAQYMLSLNNERMRNHIQSKYGDRIWTSSVNTANQTT